MENILYAVAVLGILGAVFGAILAIASKIFAVEVDERLPLLKEALPLSLRRIVAKKSQL